MASPHRLAGRVAGIAVVAAALVSAGTTHPSAAATKTPGLTPLAADWSWSQGASPRVLYTSPDRTHIAAVPAVGSVPAGNGWPAVLFYSWVSNEDTGSAGPDTMVMRSTDGGATFGAPRAAESSFYALTRLPDGHLLDVAFIPRSIAADRRTVSMRVTESPDNGSTWVAKTSTFVLPYRIPAFDRGLRVNPNIVTDAHGWLYLSYYTAFEGDSGQRAEIAVSKDGGATWQRRGPIITASSTQQYNEVGLSRTPNGQMMAVISQGQTENPGYRHHLKLVTARSSDDGATWGGYRVLPIARDPGYDYRPGPDGVVRYGILPDLELLQNGAMVLRYGRPDNWFAVSTDGGQTFRQARRTYVNIPYGSDRGTPSPYHGSSGNGTIAITGPGTVVISGDNCAAVYGCPDHEHPWTVGNRYSVWIRTVTIRPPGS